MLYDCDSNKPKEDIGRLSVRGIPRNERNTKVRKGIENLLPPNLFEERFYESKTITGDYGEQKIISTFRKDDFCKWICEQRRDASDFAGFAVVVDLLKEFLSIGKETTVEGGTGGA